jgi:hypothetical protein
VRQQCRNSSRIVSARWRPVASNFSKHQGVVRLHLHPTFLDFKVREFPPLLPISALGAGRFNGVRRQVAPCAHARMRQVNISCSNEYSVARYIQRIGRKEPISISTEGKSCVCPDCRIAVGA